MSGRCRDSENSCPSHQSLHAAMGALSAPVVPVQSHSPPAASAPVASRQPTWGQQDHTACTLGAGGPLHRAQSSAYCSPQARKAVSPECLRPRPTRGWSTGTPSAWGAHAQTAPRTHAVHTASTHACTPHTSPLPGPAQWCPSGTRTHRQNSPRSQQGRRWGLQLCLAGPSSRWGQGGDRQLEEGGPGGE